MSTAREVRAPRGMDISCKGWVQEAALRMLINNLDPEVERCVSGVQALAAVLHELASEEGGGGRA